MPYNPTTDDSIKFLRTGAKDPFPTVYDAGTPSVQDRFKKIWAEYHNKIKNFVGVVEPLCNSTTAENAGMKGLTYWSLNPAPTLTSIMYGSAPLAVSQGKQPPTTVFPFEIVITSSEQSYNTWPKYQAGRDRDSVPMLYQAPRAVLNRIAFGDLNTIKPMVQCSLRADLDTYFSTRWSVSHYCITSADTLIIRGAIIDLLAAGTGWLTSQLPPITYNFPDSDVQRLYVTLSGVRS